MLLLVHLDDINFTHRSPYRSDNDDGSVKRSAIPLIAGAIVLAQFTMTGATYAGDILTKRGVGRKPLFLAALISLPVRCALIIFWQNAGDSFLLSTQVRFVFVVMFVGLSISNLLE